MMPTSMSSPAPSSCSCKACQSACTHKPGWFLPGEVEKVATFMGLTLPELFASHLAVDWWEADEPGFVLSPAITSSSPGAEMPGNPLGRCVFYKDNQCSIHAVKPGECRWYDHSKTKDEVSANHRATYEAWKAPEHQAQIRELLGREPQTESYSIFDMFMWGR